MAHLNKLILFFGDCS